MPRTPQNLQKVSIRLFRGDKDRLDAYFPQLGYNAAIRLIVRKALRALDEKYMGDTFSVQVGGAEIDIASLQGATDADEP